MIKKITVVLTVICLMWMARSETRAVIIGGGCGWCGTSCQRMTSGVACLDIAPPEGQVCVEENGMCVVKEDIGVTIMPVLLPDLMVTTSVKESVGVTGPKHYAITTLVRNVGRAPVEGSDGFRVYLYVDPLNKPPKVGDPSSSNTGFFLDLGVGASMEWTYTTELKTGNHLFYSWVDRDNNVKESDENNNMSKSEYMVAELSCSWCGTNCIDSRIKMPCLTVQPPVGKKCTVVDGKCGIVPDDCKELWWFDDKTQYCQKKQFCGLFVYQGLRTFATLNECRSELGVKDTILIDASCGGVTMTGKRSVKVTSDIRSTKNIWKVVEDMKTRQKVIISWNEGWDMGTAYLDENSMYFGGIRRGEGYVEKLPVYSDGRSYMVRAYQADFTEGVPVLKNLLVQNSFSFNCPILPTPTISPLSTSVACGEKGSQAVATVDSTKRNVWLVVEDTVKSEKVIYSYMATGQSVVFGPNINDGYVGSIRTGGGYVDKIKVAEGGTYRIAAYTAAYTERIPQNWTLLAETKVELPKCLIVKCGICPNGTTKALGDANCDGKVDMIDFMIWKKEFLMGTTPTMADFDCSGGKPNLIDFQIWKRAFVNKQSNTQ